MAAQQAHFHAADAIPAKSLPNISVHWLFVTLGVASIAIGVVGLIGSRRPGMVGAALGVAVIATTVVLSYRRGRRRSTT